MRENFAIAIHGGAQNRNRSEITPEQELEYRRGLEDSLTSAWEILQRGGSALDAAEIAVRLLEDNPLFNAGKGSALSSTGEVEMDAAIMCGRTLRAGAVGSVRNVRNPVNLARKIMDEENYTFLSGTGALEIARKHSLEIMSDEYFLTHERIKAWQEIKDKQNKASEHDTVGAVALDLNGNLASATSTGGLRDKLKGRIGDSPVIGAGTYANNEYCAVSCTGDGDLILRGVYAFNVFALMKYKRLNLRQALRRVFSVNNESLRAEMGIIAIDKNGRIQLTSNTLPFFRAMKKNYDPPFIGVWDEK